MNSQTETANKVETTGEDIVSASWPELVFSADLLKSAENEPVQPLTAAEASAERLTEISADIPVLNRLKISAESVMASTIPSHLI